MVLEKFRFWITFCLHENENTPISNIPGWKSVFQKLRFRDGLVWTVGETVEMKLRFN